MSKIEGRNFPKSWQEVSFDLKLLFAQIGGSIVLMLLGQLLPLGVVIGLTGLLFVVLIGLSVRHRRKLGWHWPGVGSCEVLGAALATGIGLLGIGAASQWISPFDPATFSWFAGSFVMVLFGTLASLKVVFATEREFKTCCGERRLSTDEPQPEVQDTSGDRFHRVSLRFMIWGARIWMLFITQFLAVSVYMLFFADPRIFSPDSMTPESPLSERLLALGFVVVLLLFVMFQHEYLRGKLRRLDS